MSQQASAYEAMKSKIRACEMFHGRTFSAETKNTSAVILNNTVKLLNAMESLGASTSMAPAGQMNPVGSYKNFIIKVASLAIPALDVFDWVHVESMQTANSQVLFTRYVRLSDKGNSKQGDIVSDPFGIYYRRNKDGTRESVVDSDYEGELVPEVFTVAATEKEFTLKWTPVREIVSVTLNSKGTVTALTKGDGSTDKTYKLDGEKLTIGSTTEAGDIVTVTYKWDNKYLPANDLPTIGVKVEAIPLVAKPHKLRIVFDALDNLIYKNDYNVDISKELPKKAVEDFMWSIGNYVADQIIKNAPEVPETQKWSLAVSNGWLAQHYASFSTVITKAQAVLTKYTQIYAGNRMFIGTELVPVIKCVPGWKDADCVGKLGTQLIGTVGEVKVYYRPTMDAYTYVLWSKGTGSDLAVGVLGIYAAALPAAILPTQLLEFADGLNSQGFYALYDYVHINPYLSIKGTITH